MKNDPKSNKDAKPLEFLKAGNKNSLRYDYPVIFKNEQKIIEILPDAQVSDKKGVRKTFRKICAQVNDQFKEDKPSKMVAKDLKKLFGLFGFSKEHLAKKLESQVVEAIWA